MKGAACEERIRAVLAARDGVEVKQVCRRSGQAVVVFDPRRVKDAELASALERAGYPVRGETLQVTVKGMSCPACEKKVRQALAALEGVEVKRVCHRSNQAVVTFDPKRISGDRVVAAISGTGFTVVR